MKNENYPYPDSLRQKAEEQIQKRHSKKETPLSGPTNLNDPGRSDANTLRLIHELEVHQVELEMQNDQLRIAEEEALKIAEKYTALYDFFPSGYFTLNYDGTINGLNLRGANMLGNERASLLKSNFKLFVTNETIPDFNNFLQKVFESNSKETCEVRLVVDGSPSIYVYLEGAISVEGHACLVTAVDISSIKKAEEELQNSVKRYRRLFESANDGILILDAVSGGIVDVNPFLIQLLGYSYEELLGKKLWEIGTFKNIANSKAAFVELQIRGYIRTDNLPLVAKNGKPINVEFINTVYLADHEKIIHCNIRDITERNWAEGQLKKSEARLSELNATKDKFFSIIAHDLKSPFNPILGFSNLLVEQIRDKDYKKIEQSGMIIQKSSQRAMDLLMNLLEWVRSQIGKMDFIPEKIEIAALIHQITELLNLSAKQKTISIYTELPENAFVIADRAMIGTVLRNLISNAIKFTNPGGEIVILAEPKKNELVISVSDKGVGIRKEVIEKLFRIDASHKTTGTQNEQGTGLGLILCKEFVEKHGGKIWVESEVGKGSKFCFTIPKPKK